MNHRHHPLFWSFGVGTWCQVRVRISWLYPLLAGWLWYHLGLYFGLAVFGVLFLSVLFHEIGHILAARWTDGNGDEILIWPLGGLAFVEPHSSTRAQVLTTAGGPLVNLLLCGLLLPAVLYSGATWAALNPLRLPFAAAEFGDNLVVDLQVLGFSINWMLLLVNLLPAFPLDGGQMLRSLLASRTGSAVATEISVRIAYATAIGLAVAAMFVFEHVFVLGLAFLIALLALHESYQMQTGEVPDSSFMGYDFSQGYTSLERAERKAPEPRPGLFQQWLERRRAEKRRRQEQQEQTAELQLDSLLAKVHEQGFDSLSEAEKRQLKRASDRYRSRGT